MANFDLTQAKVAVDLTNPDFVNFGSFISSTPNFWDWQSVAGHQLDIIGGTFTYDPGGHAIAGTVNAIGFDLNNDEFNAVEISITGLNFPAVTLDDGADSFWRILDGNDTITGPLSANIAAGAVSAIFGDGINARAGVSTGGNDIIDAGDTQITVFGDVVNVGSQTAGAPAVIYTGGNDQISGRDTASRPFLVGDAERVHASGRMNGGDDIITVRSTAILPEASGDALSVDGVAGNSAELFGGDDVLDATGMLASSFDFGASMYGDAGNSGAFSSITGGADKLFGSNWNDNLTGDVGNSSGPLIGGADEFHGNDGDDNIVGEVFNASGPIVGGNDLMFGGNGNDRIFGEFGNGSGIILTGGNDRMYGEAGEDFMRGQSGNDLLDGGTGIDTMEGGTGNDFFYVDAAGDIAAEAAGEGTADRVFASVSYALGAGQEIETLSTTNTAGLTAINLTGNAFNNTVGGNNGANTLNGAAGADTMYGFGGNDLFFVDNALDRVIEAAGGGSDRVFASVSYALAVGQEIETLTTTNAAGLAAINLTGNAFNNTVGGNNGANTLNGAAGADTVYGFGGNDLFFVDNALDRVIEAAGGGNDRVFASVSYALTAGQEIEILTTTNTAGLGAINLTGNAFNNIVGGNNGANVINGGLGNDSLFGFLGNDIFVFNTALNAATNHDTITDFNVAADTIHLENAVFTLLGAGALAASAFRDLSLGAQDANDVIIYNRATGDLFYDSNGLAAGGQTLFADVTNGLALTAADFVVI
jgi:Ca2+-binding RTX toxin-like protein